MGDLLARCDLPVLQTRMDDERSELSQTPPLQPRKRGRKVSSIDPAVKLDLNRVKDRQRCSKYRERQRIERESLQQQVDVLTAELGARQEAEKVGRELASSTWRMIAQRELTARLGAEEQQRQLCEAVETRADYIRSFQEMLQFQSSAGGEDQQHKRLRVEPSDAAFYEAFVQDLDAIYAQTDEVLRACGLELGGENWVDSKRMWKEDDTTGFFLFTDSSFMPFDYSEACQALWHAAQLSHRREDRQIFTGMADAANTAAFKFRLSNRLSTDRVVSAVQRVVTRRYHKDGRMVLVWQSLMEGEGMFAGMRAGETGWDVLTPSTDVSKPGTVMRTCISHTPMHFDDEILREPTMKQFTGMVLEKVAEDGVEIMKEFEKLHIA